MGVGGDTHSRGIEDKTTRKECRAFLLHVALSWNHIVFTSKAILYILLLKYK